MRTAPLTRDDIAPWADRLSAAFDRPAPDMARVLARQHAAFPVAAMTRNGRERALLLERAAACAPSNPTTLDM